MEEAPWIHPRNCDRRGSIIRGEQDRDRDAIREVHEAAFPTPAEARLVDALREAGRMPVSLVAEREGAVIGHIAFSPVTLETAPQATGLGLAPVAVLPAHQRQGVGAELCKAGLRACEQMNVDFVVVLGDPRYYRRFGFTTASELGLDNEYGVDAEFMVRVLGDPAATRGGGVVRYAPEFAALE